MLSTNFKIWISDCASNPKCNFDHRWLTKIFQFHISYQNTQMKWQKLGATLEKIKLFQKLIPQRLKLHLWLHAQPEIQILKVIYSILSTNFIFAPSSIPFKGNLQQNRQTKAGELDLQWFRIMMHVTYFSTQMFCEIYFSLGAFNNYGDKIFSFFAPPPLRGQFLYPERGQKQTFFDPPPIFLST